MLASVKRSELKSRMRFRRASSTSIVTDNHDADDAKNHNSSNSRRLLQMTSLPKYSLVAILLGSVLFLGFCLNANTPSNHAAQSSIPRRAGIGAANPTIPAFILDADQQQFGDKMIRSPIDIISQNDSGKESEITHIDHYARTTLTGRYLYNCRGNGREEKNLCNAQFAFMDISDHLVQKEGLNQQHIMVVPNGISPITSLRPSAPSYPSHNEYAVLTRRGYKYGLLEHQVNQDRPFILHPKSVGAGFIMGIFDGHGSL